MEGIVQVGHGWCTSIYLTDPNGIMVEFCVTTDQQLFADQTPEEALRLLRQPPEEIAADARKEPSASRVLASAVARGTTQQRRGR